MKLRIEFTEKERKAIVHATKVYAIECGVEKECIDEMESNLFNENIDKKQGIASMYINDGIMEINVGDKFIKFICNRLESVAIPVIAVAKVLRGMLDGITEMFSDEYDDNDEDDTESGQTVTYDC